MVDFFSVTCVPCKTLSQMLEDLNADMPIMDIVKVNTTEYPELRKRFHVMGVPPLMFYKDGTLRNTHAGVMEVTCSRHANPLRGGHDYICDGNFRRFMLQSLWNFLCGIGE